MNDFVLGLICVGISSIFYGSNFVAIKSYDTRDGFFVYWIQSVAMFIEGFVVSIVIEFVSEEGVFPRWSWYAALAGALWATGNVVAVPIVNQIGFGIGILLWSSAQIFVGWATARFGWFGLDPQEPQSQVLEYLGIVITLISGAMFAMVRSQGNEAVTDEDDNKLADTTDIESHPDSGIEKTTVFTVPQTETESIASNDISSENGDFKTKELSSANGNLHQKIIEYFKGVNLTKALAVAGALASGVLYGFQMTPVTYAETKLPKNETYTQGVYYTFSYNSGIMLACTFWFLIYCVVKKNRPYVNNKTIIPALLYGLMWCIATTAWFFSDDYLSQAVSYPLTARMPGVVAALWSVLYFREIRGSRDLILLTLAIITACIGVLLVGLGKVIKT